MSLENYISLAKHLDKEEEAVSLIREVIEHPQIYVFGELIEIPYIQDLKSKSSFKWYNLLELFAYGKLLDYNQETMPVLSEAMVKKLKLLTIVTMACKTKKIPYSVLIEELNVNNLRDLEDLIIDAIYANLIKGKLDQKTSCLEIESTMARDVKIEKIDDILSVLTNWISNCENILTNIDQQVKLANSVKLDNINKKKELENYTNNIRKNLKSNNQDSDEMWEVNSITPDLEKSKKNINKTSKLFSTKYLFKK